MGKVPDTKENCAKGKSTVKVKARGCVCGDCPLTSELDLRKDYYCEDGVVE